MSEKEAFEFGMSCGAEIMLDAIQRWQHYPGCRITPAVMGLLRNQALTLYRRAHGIPEGEAEQASLETAERPAVPRLISQVSHKRPYKL